MHAGGACPTQVGHSFGLGGTMGNINQRYGHARWGLMHTLAPRTAGYLYETRTSLPPGGSAACLLMQRSSGTPPPKGTAHLSGGLMPKVISLTLRPSHIPSVQRSESVRWSDALCTVYHQLESHSAGMPSLAIPRTGFMRHRRAQAMPSHSKPPSNQDAARGQEVWMDLTGEKACHTTCFT